MLNKVLPDVLPRPEAPHGLARSLARRPVDARRPPLPGDLGDPAAGGRVLREIGESFLNYQVVATREAEQRAELLGKPEIVASVPYFETDIYDLAGLLRLGEPIWRSS